MSKMNSAANSLPLNFVIPSAAEGSAFLHIEEQQHIPPFGCASVGMTNDIFMVRGAEA